MEKNDILSGFVVLERQSADELDAVLWQMEHQKSGARLVWLERAEENKTFGIAVQTQPWDDTGIFHILEHSVLCGSERYPVKEPFVELMKSSLNTFLNAMTFPDRTFYPVSSRNDQDFINLLRVYMDAVLHPLLHSRPEIFGQEGWHYELEEDGALLRVDCGDPAGSPGTGTEYALWFDAATHALTRGEISADGFRVILCEFSDFTAG